MYAPIDPAKERMEDVLQSLGSVLDARMAREIEIRQRDGRIGIRATVVEGIAQRIGGTWIRVEQVLTHVDPVRSQVVASARVRFGHVAGSHERALRALGRLIDDRRLRDVALLQHPGTDAWLLWHRGPADTQLSLLTLTADDLATLQVGVPAEHQAPAHARAVAQQHAAPAASGAGHDRVRGQWTRLRDDLPFRQRPMTGPRDPIRARPMSMLIPAGAPSEG